MSDHQPLPGSWICTGCGDGWPCHTRRRQLTAEYLGRPEVLTFYMAGQCIRAQSDLEHLGTLALHRRFVGWTR